MSPTQNKGWLANPQRRQRRDASYTFTDEDAEALINKIDQQQNYISETLKRPHPELDEQLRLRDKALIATAWIFFKRGGEVLRVKRKDVKVTEKQILFTFSISKKAKRFKICQDCGTKNGYRSKFCRECRADLVNTEVIKEGKPVVATKTKTLKNKFVGYIVEWLKELDRIRPKSEDIYLFPALRVVFSSGFFDFLSEKPMTVQNFDRILQKLDPNMTSCLFRYGGAEKYLRLGYLPHELKEIGDWATSRMPELYSSRKGLTPTMRRWSEDVR